MASLSQTGSVQWSSRFAFIMAAVGSSVGLGNLWRFSAEAGSNGGGAFIIVYLACVFLIGIPVLMSEYLMGRAGQANSAVISVEDLAQRSNSSKKWASAAWIGMVASFLIVSFYCVVAAWVMAYIPKFLGGAFDGQTASQIEAKFAGENGLISTPAKVIPWFLIFAFLTTWTVSRGVNRGIETAAKILMPIFFVLLACLSLYGIFTGLSSGGTVKAVKFLFTPDFNKINGEVAASALGQACFSLGIGSAIMITYGSYLPNNINIPRAALTVGLVDTFVAMIAGFAIFPIMFTYGLNPGAGAGIFFISLPTALSAAPFGNFIGGTFFFLAIFAALTSSISLLEPICAWFSEKYNLSKAKASYIMGGLMTLLGLVFVFNQAFFDFIDTGLTGPIMLPLSALLVVLFTGWRMDKAIIEGQISLQNSLLAKLLYFLTKYVAPIFVLIVLVVGIYENPYLGLSS